VSASILGLLELLDSDLLYKDQKLLQTEEIEDSKSTQILVRKWKRENSHQWKREKGHRVRILSFDLRGQVPLVEHLLLDSHPLYPFRHAKS
jgi:hypothetical protein